MYKDKKGWSLTKWVVHVSILVVVGVVIASLAAFLVLYYENPANQVTNFISSAENKLSQALSLENYVENATYAKMLLSGARSDTQQAMNILEAASIDPVGKEVTLIVCRYDLHMIEMAEDYVDAMVHYGLGLQSMYCSDWSNVEIEFLKAENEIDEAQADFLLAKEEFEQINFEYLSPELKTLVIEYQTLLSEYETVLPDVRNYTDATIPLALGMGDLLNGVNQIALENWSGAKLALENSQSNILDARNKFDNIKSCETTMIASSAISMFSGCETTANALMHYIQACVYGEKGDTSSAISEIETGNQILQNAVFT